MQFRNGDTSEPTPVTPFEYGAESEEESIVFIETDNGIICESSADEDSSRCSDQFKKSQDNAKAVLGKWLKELDAAEAIDGIDDAALFAQLKKDMLLILTDNKEQARTNLHTILSMAELAHKVSYSNEVVRIVPILPELKADLVASITEECKRIHSELNLEVIPEQQFAQHHTLAKMKT